MYEVSHEIKELLKEDNVLKYLKITFLDGSGVIPYSCIESESFEFRQSIWDGDSFRFGGCIASYLRFNTLDYSPDIIGKAFKAEIVIPGVTGNLYGKNGFRIVDSNGKSIKMKGSDYTSAHSAGAIEHFVQTVGGAAYDFEVEENILAAIPIGVFTVESNELEANGVVRNVVSYDAIYAKRDVNLYDYFLNVCVAKELYDGGITWQYMDDFLDGVSLAP